MMAMVQVMKDYNEASQQFEDADQQAWHDFIMNEEVDRDFLNEAWDKLGQDNFEFDRRRFMEGLKQNTQIMNQRVSSLQTRRTLNMNEGGRLKRVRR